MKLLRENEYLGGSGMKIWMFATVVALISGVSVVSTVNAQSAAASAATSSQWQNVFNDATQRALSGQGGVLSSSLVKAMGNPAAQGQAYALFTAQMAGMRKPNLSAALAAYASSWSTALRKDGDFSGEMESLQGVYKSSFSASVSALSVAGQGGEMINAISGMGFNLTASSCPGSSKIVSTVFFPTSTDQAASTGLDAFVAGLNKFSTQNVGAYVSGISDKVKVFVTGSGSLDDEVLAGTKVVLGEYQSVYSAKGYLNAQGEFVSADGSIQSWVATTTQVIPQLMTGMSPIDALEFGQNLCKNCAADFIPLDGVDLAAACAMPS